MKNKYSIILILGFTVFILFNMLILQIDNKFNLKFDMTANKIYNLDKETIDLVNNLNQNININVISKKEEYPSMLSEIINNYQKASSHINVNYIDPYENPALLNIYIEEGYKLEQNDIIVESNIKKKHILYRDMLTYSGDEVVGIKLEQQLSSAILNICRNDEYSVSFSKGHNEQITESLKSIFSDNGFDLEMIPLSSNKNIETDILVIASPMKDFTNDEIIRLRNYVKLGGNIIVFIEPGIQKLTNLEEFLKTYNIEVLDNIVFEKKAYISNNPINIVPMYAGHKINEYFSKNPYYLVTPSSRALNLIKVEDNVSSSPILVSTKDAYAKSSNDKSLVQDKNDLKGEFVLAAISEKNEGKIFVSGSKNFYADDILKTETYANNKFISEVVNYMCDKNVSLSIPGKTITSPKLSVTAGRSFIIFTITAILIPGLILVYGIIVFMKRKNL
ncbi:MAG: Gldg family protein [Proteocatella sp.]